MSKREEKTFEENIKSLKTGCIIFGVLYILSLIIDLYNMTQGQNVLISLIVSIIMLALIFFMYRFTKARNPIGPTLELIFGILMIISGIFSCFTIIMIPWGILLIILAIGIIKESQYFKKELSNNQNI